MIKIKLNNTEYTVDKTKLIFILNRLTDRKISEPEILDLLERFHLLDKDFLESIKEL